MAWSMADSPDGTKRPINLNFPAELRNGEGIIGYEYLHDTNQVDLTPGGFQMQGEATKVKGGRTDCLQVDFDVVYRWNDRMDPNLKFTSDNIKARLARMFANPKTTTFGSGHRPNTGHRMKSLIRLRSMNLGIVYEN